MPETLLVVGGGYIGLEMGTVYAELGSKVTVVELTRPVAGRRSRPGQAAADRLAKAVRRHSPEYEGRVAGRRAAKRSKWSSKVPTANGTANVQPRAGVGRPPAQQPGAWAWRTRRSSSTSAGSSSPTTQQRTADPHILAIGDVAGEPMLAHKATHEGKVAVEALLGEPAAFDAAGHSGRRVHRSRNRLGRTDRRAGEAARHAKSRSPAIRGRPAAGPSPRPHRRVDQAADRSRDRARAGRRHRRRRAPAN